MANAHNVKVCFEHNRDLDALIRQDRNIQKKPHFNAMITKGLDLLRLEHRTPTTADLAGIKDLNFRRPIYIKVERHLLDHIADIAHHIDVLNRGSEIRWPRTKQYHVAAYLYHIGEKRRQQQEQRISMFLRKTGNAMPLNDDFFSL